MQGTPFKQGILGTRLSSGADSRALLGGWGRSVAFGWHSLFRRVDSYDKLRSCEPFPCYLKEIWMKKVVIALLLALSLVGGALASDHEADRCELLQGTAKAICEAYYERGVFPPQPQP